MNKQERQEAVNKIVNKCGVIDLSGLDLKEADLKWANLYKANLKWANINEADLYGANLYKANLKGAKLREANLEWLTQDELKSIINQNKDIYNEIKGEI